MKVEPGQVLSFRLARAGLAAREAPDLAAAARCPASDFGRDAALLSLAARAEEVTREAFDVAVDAGDVVLAHSLRCAIHAHAPGAAEVFGRPLIGAGERELRAQMSQVARLGVAAGDALEEVAAAVDGALAAGPLTKDELHEALRQRVRSALLPWCESCRSHHVPGSLWRCAAVRAGTRLDARRRYRKLAGAPPPAPGEAVRRFLRFYGPARPADFAAWAGVTPSHARRLWDAAELDLVEVGGFGALLRDDAEPLRSAPAASGVRLLPAGDPFLQRPNRELLVGDPELRRRLFRPAGSPNVVLLDGQVAGVWRLTRAGASVEPFVRLPRAAVEEEVERARSATAR